MKNRVNFVLGILLAAALGWAIWRAMRPRKAEPVYEGHPLTYWLAPSHAQPKISPSDLRSVGAPGELLTPALARRLQTDPSAVPFLVRALRRDSWAGAALHAQSVWPKLPPSVKRHLPAPPVDDREARRNAAILLAGMGSIAKPAIPALIRALKEEEYVDVRVFDAMALGYLGKGDKAAKAALKEATKDKASFVRQAATNALKNIDLDAAAQAVEF
jgi:hypothetical protein